MANLVIPRGQYYDTDNVISIKIPVGLTDVSDGALFVASTLDTTEKGDDVYAATVPAANTDDNLCIVVLDEFYEDANGNRIDITDPTKIQVQAGAIVRAYRLVKHRRFDISDGAITGTAVAREYLIPTRASTTLTASATIPAGAKAFQVEKIDDNITYTGLNPLNGVIARVVVE